MTEKQAASGGHRKKVKKPAKTFLLGARVSEKDFLAWEQRYLKHGTHRSEIIREMLQIGKARNRRVAVSKEALYDYARAMLMRGSVEHIQKALDFVQTIDDKDVQNEAQLKVNNVVFIELKRIKRELDALQLRSGLTSRNPAVLQRVDFQDYFESTQLGVAL
jgi:hypothetical protein